MRIQPKRSFEPVDALLVETDKPEHRAMLENFREHMRAEISCDLDAIMSTMTAEPEYHMYGAGGDMAPKNREQTRAFYQSIFDMGSNVLELVCERLTVDDWGIAGDGMIHIIYPGKSLAAVGVDIDDEGATYLLSLRQAFFLPYENGLMAGEDTYADMAGATVTKLAPDEIVTTEQAFA